MPARSLVGKRRGYFPEQRDLRLARAIRRTRRGRMKEWDRLDGRDGAIEVQQRKFMVAAAQDVVANSPLTATWSRPVNEPIFP
jgi:hypothetical protein